MDDGVEFTYLDPSFGEAKTLTPSTEAAPEDSPEDRLCTNSTTEDDGLPFETTPLCSNRARCWPEAMCVESPEERYFARCPFSFLHIQVALFTILWWMAAVFVVLYMKRTLTYFHYPFLITWLCNTWCGLMAMCISLMVHPDPLPSIRQDEILKLVLIGIVNGVEIGCCNKALDFLSVSSNIMIGSVKVLFQITSGICWGLEHLTALRVLTGLVFVLGGFLQAFARQTSREDDTTCIQGVLLQLFAIVMSSQRFAVLQYIMQRASDDSFLGQMSKLQLVAGILPITGIVCMCLSALFEAPWLRYEHLAQPQLYISTMLLACGVMIVVISELKIVQLTSAVALQVLMTLHTIPIILSGVLVLGERVSTLSVFGFITCLTGALVYAAVRLSENRDAEIPR